MDVELHVLQKWINESDNIVFVSGKDFSKEAGFPDYREMDEDFLKTFKYTPDQMLCLTFLQRYPMFFYRYYRAKILAPVLEAKPSPAHEFLARLEEAGKLKAILTVNIDGIHQEAGSREVLEMHGSVMRSWCAKCEKYLDFFYIADSPTPIPYCNVDMCGDYVRPDIVLKEEPYDLAHRPGHGLCKGLRHPHHRRLGPGRVPGAQPDESLSGPQAGPDEHRPPGL